MGPTKPEAGVMATSPATAPDAAPTMLGLPRKAHDMNIHARAPAAAAVLVTTKALVASPREPRALPALKPNHPNHRSAAPSTMKGTLWGSIGSRPKPIRFPKMSAAARAAKPELMWTTVPPAKSSAPSPPAPSHPSVLHTQWARGA